MIQTSEQVGTQAEHSQKAHTVIARREAPWQSQTQEVFRPWIKEREAAYARRRQLAGTGKTTTDITEAVLAAFHGRVEGLFVAIGVQVWGRFDPGKDKVDVHKSPEPGDEDLLDLSAIQTLIKGGTVYAVTPQEVPDQALVAALLRY